MNPWSYQSVLGYPVGGKNLLLRYRLDMEKPGEARQCSLHATSQHPSSLQLIRRLAKGLCSISNVVHHNAGLACCRKVLNNSWFSLSTVAHVTSCFEDHCGSFWLARSNGRHLAPGAGMLPCTSPTRSTWRHPPDSGSTHILRTHDDTCALSSKYNSLESQLI